MKNDLYAEWTTLGKGYKLLSIVSTICRCRSPFSHPRWWVALPKLDKQEDKNEGCTWRRNTDNGGSEENFWIRESFIDKTSKRIYGSTVESDSKIG